MSRSYHKKSSLVAPNGNTKVECIPEVENTSNRSIKRGIYNNNRKKNHNAEVLNCTKPFRCPGITTSSHNINNSNPNTNINKVGEIFRQKLRIKIMLI